MVFSKVQQNTYIGFKFFDEFKLKTAYFCNYIFGTLLVEGNPVRLSGQDSIRGTFSHRHAMWQDMNTASSA